MSELHVRISNVSRRFASSCNIDKCRLRSACNIYFYLTGNYLLYFGLLDVFGVSIYRLSICAMTLECE